MTDHECNHEADLAKLSYVCSQVIPDMQSTLNKILEKLVGNGKNGLVTDIELLKQKHDNMPSTRALVFYASIGGGGTVLAGFLGTAVLKSLGWM